MPLRQNYSIPRDRPEDDLKPRLEKMRNPQKSPPLSSASAVPMASTEDRSETREDARSFIDEQLDALLTN